MLIIVVFLDDLDTFGDKIDGVETDTKLTNHGNISTRTQSLHEMLKERC